MFTKARFRLTGFYLLILIAIISVFSVLLFRYTEQHVRDNLEEDTSQQAAAEQLIDELQYAIIFGDGIIILCSGFLSYWLAGKTLKPIKTALDAQEQFSASASHELRTPLAVVKSDLEIFLKKSQPTIDDAKAVAARSLEEIDRMGGMVENLLTLARSKKAEVDIEFEEVSIARPIHAAVKKLKSSAEGKHLSLIVQKEADALVLGNERLLEQLFFNVIQNAITYSDKGSIAIAITSGEDVRVRITDTGMGIAKEKLTHVFEPFYKADESRDAGTGVGLGLAIVKEIAAKHHGTVAIESELQKGTVITISLPHYPKSAS